jgi:hypothetical protein
MITHPHETPVVLGTHMTINLDKHRGMAAQKDTELRRLLAEVEATISRSPSIQISAANHAANRKAFHMSSFKKFSSEHGVPTKDLVSDKPKDRLATDQLATQPKKALAKEMARYGITRVPADYYHYGAFRYTSLKDAIAEAKRASQR